MRGATVNKNEKTEFRFISIHAPHARCDVTIMLILYFLINFNPRTPCEVRRQTGHYNRRACNFNPRTPCEVRQTHKTRSFYPQNFNPRTPCEVRHDSKRHPLYCNYFNPRTPCEVRRGRARLRYSSLLFQSTHPMRGATRFDFVCSVYGLNFNPRTPCEVRPHVR